MGVIRSVFVSHTSDMARFPGGRSFVRAAIDAVSKAGHRAVDMAYFAARDEEPAYFCVQQVTACNIYVGLIGLRYGSLVPDGGGVSYTELEFQTATRLGIPRLVFLLDEDVSLPDELADVPGGPVDGFRKRLQSGDLITAGFRTADGVEAAVILALSQLDLDRDVRSGRGMDGRANGGVTRPWMVPAAPAAAVARPEVLDPLTTAVLAEGDSTVGVATAVEGAGGFGKTTLVQMVCASARVRDRFAGGALWVTIGEHTAGADLAGLVNGLCEVLSGMAGTSSDPMVAGTRLGALLDDRPATLLVVDDVWERGQLAPFLLGGQRCRRLVTTRIRGVVPAGAVSVLVDQMEQEHARRTITAGVDGVPAATVDRLMRVTGRWAVLLGLVNAQLVDLIGDGVDVREAAVWVAGRLELEGPTVLDVDDARSRGQAVAATVEASLTRLSGSERDLLVELAIFPEDAEIPASVLALLWGHDDALSAQESERLRRKLVRLRLVQQRWVDGEPAIALHDVLRAYLGRRLAPADAVSGQGRLVAAARRLCAAPNTQLPDTRTAWWMLPDSAGYLWRHVVGHLVEAGLFDEAAALAGDLRWVEAKTRRFGSTVGAEADLALVATPTAEMLRRALCQEAHLLTPLDPPTGLGATLASRLAGVTGLEQAVASYRDHLPRPRLDNIWPLPDLPSPTLRRTLDHNGWVFGCVFSPDGTLLATASGDRMVRLWDVAAGTERTVFDGHTDKALRCVFSPDGALLATTSEDRTVRLWDVAAGTERTVFDGHAA
uniref:DUF4062 domain-containing protein n=1 Tax=Frankia sp. Cr1 TaxID=3073931 RepID=UPI002AD5569E